MYNLFLKILILIVFISTLCIIGLKPKMHNKVLVFDNSYSIIEDTPEIEVETVIPQKEQTVVQKKIVSDETKKVVQKKQIEPKKVINEKKVVQQPKYEVKTIQKPQNIKNDIKENKVLIKAEPKKIETKKTEIPKKETAKTQTKPEIKVLSKQEEEIAWNIWRSNLQNQIMNDTKLPYIPKGTVFKFSFDVDKYGRISNIKTWSLTPNYTPYAIQYIAPVIRSYQGKDILDFPTGTQRLTTKFTGGWRISDSAVYSTPGDYNDIEKVKK